MDVELVAKMFLILSFAWIMSCIMLPIGDCKEEADE